MSSLTKPHPHSNPSPIPLISQNSSSSSNMGKTVINAETEVLMHRILYNWEIANFDRICTPESDEFEPISSKPFRAGQEINRDSEWDLILSAEGGYLQIWLYLKKIFNEEEIKEISVNLTVLILKADGTTLLRRRCDKNQTFTAEDNGWGMGYILTIETLWDDRENYLQDNKLRLQIQLDILGDLISSFKDPTSILLTNLNQSSSSTSKSHKRKRIYDIELDNNEDNKFETLGQDRMRKDMTKMYKSGNGSDVTILCDGKEYKGHRSVLMARSPYFFTPMFSSSFLESTTSIVTIKDTPSSTFDRILRYIYTASTPKLENETEEQLSSLIEAADRFQLKELKFASFRALCRKVTLSNVGGVVVLAWLHNGEGVVRKELRGYCQSNWDTLLKKKDFREYLMRHPRAFFDEIKENKDDDSEEDEDL